MKLIPLPAVTDNCPWMLHDVHQALVVDPGDAQPVLEALQHLHVQLEAILVTHHHPHHTGGVDALRIATGVIQAAQGFDASANDELSISLPPCAGGKTDSNETSHYS